MERAIDETNRRRTIQKLYNEENGIVPKGIVKENNSLDALSLEDENQREYLEKMTSAGAGDFEGDIDYEIELLTKKMREFAANLEFELAAKMRDEIEVLKKLGKKR